MSRAHTPSKLPWNLVETAERLELCHDHRWLRIFGIPLATLGLVAAVAVWFIPVPNFAEAWPLLAVGSLMGLAFTLLGAHLSFNRVTIAADRRAQQLIHSQGFGIFTRSRRVPLNEVLSGALLRRTHAGSTLACYTFELVMCQRRVLVAAFPEPEPVVHTARRWSEFLNIDLDERT
jgi:hypothetical protein